MKNNLVCDCNIIHQKSVDNAIKNMPESDKKQKVASLFKVLGNETRMNIMFTLLQGEMCVCDISAVLNMTKSAVSHQLNILRESRLVRYEKRGKEVYYSVDDDHVYDIVEIALEHISHEN